MSSKCEDYCHLSVCVSTFATATCHGSTSSSICQIQSSHPCSCSWSAHLGQSLVASNQWPAAIVPVTPSELYTNTRVDICRDRHDRRSCKLCSSCVNFPGKQRNFSNNLRTTTRFTHTKCDFALKLLRFYTPSQILTKSY